MLYTVADVSVYIVSTQVVPDCTPTVEIQIAVGHNVKTVSVRSDDYQSVIHTVPQINTLTSVRLQMPGIQLNSMNLLPTRYESDERLPFYSL